MTVYILFAANLFQFCSMDEKIHQLKAETVLQANHIKDNVEIPCAYRIPMAHCIVHEDPERGRILSQ